MIQNSKGKNRPKGKIVIPELSNCVFMQLKSWDNPHKNVSTQTDKKLIKKIILSIPCLKISSTKSFKNWKTLLSEGKNN